MTDRNRIRHQLHLQQLSLCLYGPVKRTFFISTEFNYASALSHLKGPRVRFSAFLPALHLLKDALPLRTMLSMQQTLQPRKRIKVITSKLHVGTIRTDDMMHPNRDAFSRARIPYLECSPPRKVKASIVELVKEWENVEIYRYLGDSFDVC